MLSGYVDGKVGDTFCEEFNVSSRREATEEEREELELEGDSVKEFFLVFIDLGEDSMAMLLGIFDGSKVAECDVGAGVAWAIGFDVVGEDVLLFKGGR